jgi:DNA-binding XRE family transcriptional regulator
MNTILTMTKVNKNLKSLRKKHDYTQRKLAEFLEIHPTTYNKIELGDIALDFKKAQKLADLYAVTLNDIFQEVDLESTNIIAEEPSNYQAQKPIRLYIEIDGQRIESERLPSIIQKLEALIAEENKKSKG